jgi:hypothetical protein
MNVLRKKGPDQLSKHSKQDTQHNTLQEGMQPTNTSTYIHKQLPDA